MPTIYERDDTPGRSRKWRARRVGVVEGREAPGRCEYAIDVQRWSTALRQRQEAERAERDALIARARAGEAMAAMVLRWRYRARVYTRADIANFELGISNYQRGRR